MAAFLLCPHMVFPLCMHVAGVWRGAAQRTLQRRTCWPLQGVQWADCLADETNLLDVLPPLVASHTTDLVKWGHQDLAILAQGGDTDRQVSLQNSFLGEPWICWICRAVRLLSLPNSASYPLLWSLTNILHPNFVQGPLWETFTCVRLLFLSDHLIFLSHIPWSSRKRISGNSLQINI